MSQSYEPLELSVPYEWYRFMWYGVSLCNGLSLLASLSPCWYYHLYGIWCLCALRARLTHWYMWCSQYSRSLGSLWLSRWWLSRLWSICSLACWWVWSSWLTISIRWLTVSTVRIELYALGELASVPAALLGSFWEHSWEVVLGKLLGSLLGTSLGKLSWERSGCNRYSGDSKYPEWLWGPYLTLTLKTCFICTLSPFVSSLWYKLRCDGPLRENKLKINA